MVRRFWSALTFAFARVIRTHGWTLVLIALVGAVTWGIAQAFGWIVGSIYIAFVVLVLLFFAGASSKRGPTDLEL